MQDEEGQTAVQLAAEGGHEEIVARLLDGNRSAAEKGLTALHLAVQVGQAPLVQRLLALPACPLNAKDSDGMTALHWAASKGKAPRPPAPPVLLRPLWCHCAAQHHGAGCIPVVRRGSLIAAFPSARY